MSDQMTDSEKKRVNVLCLDGGGVRGLSTLLILRDLLCRLNRKVNPTTHNGQPIHPSEVFDLVVGTSTGGLIALMMVKFNMSVDECIEQYRKLSKKIFKQWHVVGRFSGGFGTVKKFSSRNLRKVLLNHVISPSLEGQDVEATEYLMEQVDRHPNLMCSVVCREIYRTTKQRTPRTVFLCTHWDASEPSGSLVCNACCRAQYHESKQSDRVKVIDAARATSAAPTYFKYVELLGTLLVDGGFGDTNNPSHAAYLHYFFNPAQYESIQMVNIGTGTEPPREIGWQPPKAFPVDYLPWLQGVARTTKDLATLATESERVGALMRNQALMSPEGLLKFDRFSANRDEIHQIRLYKYKMIGKIEEITQEYLRDGDVQAQLEKLADQLADTWQLQKQRRDEATTAIQAGSSPEAEQLQQSVAAEQESAPSDQVEPEHNEQIDYLCVPGTLPGLTDTSSCGSIELPPTPRRGPARLTGFIKSRGRSPKSAITVAA